MEQIDHVSEAFKAAVQRIADAHAKPISHNRHERRRAKVLQRREMVKVQRATRPERSMK